MTQGKAADKAAKTLKTFATYVKAAKKLEKDAPDLLEEVRSGEMNNQIISIKCQLGKVVLFMIIQFRQFEKVLRESR